MNLSSLEALVLAILAKQQGTVKRLPSRLVSLIIWCLSTTLSWSLMYRTVRLATAEKSWAGSTKSFAGGSSNRPWWPLHANWTSAFEKAAMTCLPAILLQCSIVTSVQCTVRNAESRSSVFFHLSHSANRNSVRGMANGHIELRQWGSPGRNQIDPSRTPKREWTREQYWHGVWWSMLRILYTCYLYWLENCVICTKINAYAAASSKSRL